MWLVNLLGSISTSLKLDYYFFLSILGCSYYAARSMADDAQLVFCPYSYIINPVIRGAMEVDIIGAILVLDEAQYALQFSLPLLEYYT